MSKSSQDSASQEISSDKEANNRATQPVDISDSQTTGRKTRSSKRTKTASSSQESQEGDDKKCSRETRSSKKFKLYSADNTMLLPDSQDSQSGRRKSTRGKKQKGQDKGEDQKDIALPGENIEKEPEKQTKTKTQKQRGGQRKKTTPNSSQESQEGIFD